MMYSEFSNEPPHDVYANDDGDASDDDATNGGDGDDANVCILTVHLHFQHHYNDAKHAYWYYPKNHFLLGMNKSIHVRTYSTHYRYLDNFLMANHRQMKMKMHLHC